MTKGSCLCKGFQFEVSGPFINMMNCYCSMCRKAHGADYASFAGCQASDYKVLQGADLETSYQSSEKGVRRFCKVCGSPLPMAWGDQVYMPAGLLEEDPGVRASAHIFVGSKAAWVEIHGDAPQFDAYPPM